MKTLDQVNSATFFSLAEDSYRGMGVTSERNRGFIPLLLQLSKKNSCFSFLLQQEANLLLKEKTQFDWLFLPITLISSEEGARERNNEGRFIKQVKKEEVFCYFLTCSFLLSESSSFALFHLHLFSLCCVSFFVFLLNIHIFKHSLCIQCSTSRHHTLTK